MPTAALSATNLFKTGGGSSTYQSAAGVLLASLDFSNGKVQLEGENAWAVPPVLPTVPTTAAITNTTGFSITLSVYQIPGQVKPSVMPIAAGAVGNFNCLANVTYFTIASTFTSPTFTIGNATPVSPAPVAVIVQNTTVTHSIWSNEMTNGLANGYLLWSQNAGGQFVGEVHASDPKQIQVSADWGVYSQWDSANTYLSTYLAPPNGAGIVYPQFNTTISWLQTLNPSVTGSLVMPDASFNTTTATSSAMPSDDSGQYAYTISVVVSFSGNNVSTQAPIPNPQATFTRTPAVPQTAIPVIDQFGQTWFNINIPQPNSSGVVLITMTLVEPTDNNPFLMSNMKYSFPYTDGSAFAPGTVFTLGNLNAAAVFPTTPSQNLITHGTAMTMGSFSIAGTVMGELVQRDPNPYTIPYYYVHTQGGTDDVTLREGIFPEASQFTFTYCPLDKTMSFSNLYHGMLGFGGDFSYSDKDFAILVDITIASPVVPLQQMAQIWCPANANTVTKPAWTIVFSLGALPPAPSTSVLGVVPVNSTDLLILYTPDVTVSNPSVVMMDTGSMMLGMMRLSGADDGDMSRRLPGLMKKSTLPAPATWRSWRPYGAFVGQPVPAVMPAGYVTTKGTYRSSDIHKDNIHMACVEGLLIVEAAALTALGVAKYYGNVVAIALAAVALVAATAAVATSLYSCADGGTGYSYMPFGTGSEGQSQIVFRHSFTMTPVELTSDSNTQQVPQRAYLAYMVAQDLPAACANAAFPSTSCFAKFTAAGITNFGINSAFSYFDPATGQTTVDTVAASKLIADGSICRSVNVAGANDYRSCPTIMNMSQQMCTGFLSDDYRDGCADACAAAPGGCQQAFKTICTGGTANPLNNGDCGCLNAQSSDLLETVILDSNGAGMNYNTFNQTFQAQFTDTFPECLWQPCFLGPDNTLLRGSALNNPGFYTSCPTDDQQCINDAFNNKISKSTVTINTFESCLKTPALAPTPSSSAFRKERMGVLQWSGSADPAPVENTAVLAPVENTAVPHTVAKRSMKTATIVILVLFVVMLALGVTACVGWFKLTPRRAGRQGRK